MSFVIEGVFCAAATPLKEDGTPDLPLFGAHARALLEEGCHGVALLGSTGEAASFGLRITRSTIVTRSTWISSCRSPTAAGPT